MATVEERGGVTMKTTSGAMTNRRPINGGVAACCRADPVDVERSLHELTPWQEYPVIRRHGRGAYMALDVLPPARLAGTRGQQTGQERRGN